MDGEKKLNVVADVRRQLDELRRNAGKALCLCANQARLLEEIELSSRHAMTKKFFNQKARTTLFIADCWRAQMEISDSERAEFLKIRHAVQRHLAVNRNTKIPAEPQP